MQLTFKTLQQKQFKLEVESTDTILSVKQKIEQSQGHLVSQQKLIFSGKILVDDKKVEEYNIGEKDFLVVMVAKPKTAPASSSSTSAAATPKKEEPVKQEATAPAPTAAAPTPAPTPAPASTPATAPASSPAAAPVTSTAGSPDNQLVTGTSYESAVQNMMEMGFERDQIKRAMRASFNNPERAVEYLFNGIPDHLATEEQHHQQEEHGAQEVPDVEMTSAPTSPPTAAAAPADTGADASQNLFLAAQQAAQQQRQQQQQSGGEGVDFSQLRNTPHFQQLRQLVQSNPNLLQPLLQQLGQSNPELLRMINADPQGFFQLLLEGADDEEGGPPQGSHVIQVTQEEKEAIDRLESLGFARQQAIEAYFACDKNEDLAANYLFDHGADDFE